MKCENRLRGTNARLFDVQVDQLDCPHKDKGCLIPLELDGGEHNECGTNESYSEEAVRRSIQVG